MDERVLIEMISTLGEKIGVLDGRYEKLTERNNYYERMSESITEKLISIEKKLDGTYDKVTELKADIIYIKQDGADLKARIKTELDLVWGEMRRLNEDITSSYKSQMNLFAERQEKDLNENYAKKIYVEDKVSSVKLWILTSSVGVLFIAVTYFLSKIFNVALK